MKYFFGTNKYDKLAILLWGIFFLLWPHFYIEESITNNFLNSEDARYHFKHFFKTNFAIFILFFTLSFIIIITTTNCPTGSFIPIFGKFFLKKKGYHVGFCNSCVIGNEINIYLFSKYYTGVTYDQWAIQSMLFNGMTEFKQAISLQKEFVANNHNNFEILNKNLGPHSYAISLNQEFSSDNFKVSTNYYKDQQILDLPNTAYNQKCLEWYLKNVLPKKNEAALKQFLCEEHSKFKLIVSK